MDSEEEAEGQTGVLDLTELSAIEFLDTMTGLMSSRDAQCLEFSYISQFNEIITIYLGFVTAEPVDSEEEGYASIQ